MLVEVAIIGMGPGGIATALQLKRYGINPLLFEKQICGGLLRNAYCVENYLGLSEGIAGVDLLNVFQKHLKRYQIKPVMEEVLDLTYDTKKRFFVIKTGVSVYYSKLVVVASGTKPKIDGLLENATEKVVPYIFYEVYPILQEQNKTVVVIGGGDAAFDFALSVSKNNKTFLINRTDKIKALPILAKKILQNKRIFYKSNYVLKSVIAGREKALTLIFENGADKCIIDSDYLIAGIGRVPQKDFYSPFLVENDKNLISKELLYSVGDVGNGFLRQISIAVADGVRVAMQIYMNLKTV